MWHYLWPLMLIVCSNVVYNLSAKSTPQTANPFFSLVVTYLIGATFSFGLFYFTSSNRSIPENISELNWTSLLLGLAIVGLETGYIYLYRAGWDIGKGPLTANIALTSILLIIGALFFQESITLKQFFGILLCFAGLLMINTK